MAKKKSLNPGIGFILFMLFLIIGFVGGIFVKIYLFVESYKIPETVEGIHEVSVGSLDADVIKNEDLSIHFIELGNKYTGDCTLIKVGATEILIDAGSKANSVDDIYNYASTFVDGDLDYVVVTHAHQDHYAGFATENSIFDKFSVGTVIQFARTNQNSEKGLYKQYLEEIAETKEEHGTKVYTALECYNSSVAGATRSFDLGNNTSMDILYHKFYEQKAPSENDYSVCLMINKNDSNYYMFTGDLEEDGEESLVEEYFEEYGKNLPEVDLYKAGHHGSKTSSSESLLSVIKPDVVCVCCCAGSSEYTSKVENQFPTQAFIDRISVYTTQVYVTTMCLDYNEGSFKSFNGNIVVCTNSEGEISVACADNNLVLKDTEWFKENRVCPEAWAA